MRNYRNLKFLILNIIIILSVLCNGFTFNFGSVNAYAGTNDYVSSVTVTCLCEHEPIEGASIRLYCIGDYDTDYGTYNVKEQYTSVCTSDDLASMTLASENAEMSEDLKSYIEANDLSPEYEATSGEDGSVLFSSVAQGVYLMIAYTTDEYTTDPVLFTAPQLKLNKSWNTRVSLTTKTIRNEIETTPEETTPEETTSEETTPEEESTTPEETTEAETTPVITTAETEAATPEETTAAPTTPEETTKKLNLIELVKTGDTTNIVIMVVAMVLAGVLFFGLKKKDGEDNTEK